jgi:chloramphenicol 3-O phosphotransferase
MGRMMTTKGQSEPGRIIALNGVSSSGKTTLARALQVSLPEPYYLVQLDAFEDMIPERLLVGGAVENTALTLSAKAMHTTLALLSANGVGVIADYVFLDAPGLSGWLRDCVETLYELPVLFVGVHCSLQELERRELQRGDRDVGQAKWQFPRVHTHTTYDLQVDTSECSIDECVRAITERLCKPGRAFSTLHRRFAPVQGAGGM